MPARRPLRRARSRLRADFDAGVSEVLGNVILIVITVSLLGGFGALVLTTVNRDTPTPPAASFTVTPVLGDDVVDVRLVSGSSIELAGATLVLSVNGDHLTQAMGIADDPLDTLWEPGESLRLELTRALAGGDQLLFIAADDESGKSIGTAYATVSQTVAGTILRDNLLEPELSFDPAELVTDGVSTTTATIDVGSSMGLLLVDHVILDLSPIGGVDDLRLNDDGLGGDDVAGDGIFSASFSASGYDYPMLPGFASESITATVYDVLGKSEPAVGILLLREPTQSKAGAGVVYRGIGSSTEVGTTGYIDLAQFVLSTGAKLVNDEIELRVSDLDDPTKVWSALVSLGYDEDGCTGPSVRSVTLTEVSGDNPGSVVYKPTVCFEIGPEARLNVAVLEDSEDEDPSDDGAVREWQPFEADGTTPMDANDAEDFRYYNAQISAENEALIAFFGDAFSFSPTERGLSQTDFEWGPGEDDVPAPITSLTADAGDALVDLDWTEPDDGGNPITSYNVYRNGVLVASVAAPATSYQATGLTNGVEYTFRVRAVNGQGEASNSNAAVATPTGLPGAPPNLVATAGAAQVTLTWDAPSSGGSAILDYEIWMSTTSGAETQLAATGGANRTFVVNSLTNGQIYYFTVRATNANGDGPASAEASATPTTAPGAPSLTATAGAARVTLTWDAGTTGGSALTNYKVYRGTTSGGETLLASTGSGANTSFIDETAQNGVTYYYVIRAVNANGDGALSNEETATPQALETVPSQTQDLAAARANRSVVLTWNAPASDGGAAISAYYVYMGSSSGSTTYLASTGAPNLTFTVNGLTNGVTYWFNVTAVNVVGQGPSSAEASQSPGAAPYPPTLATATRGNGTVALSWSAPSNDGGFPVTNYRVYVGTSSGGQTHLAATGGANTTFTVNGLTNGVTYWSNVTAENVVGQSSGSNELSAVPATIPNPPASPSATGGDTTVTLAWTVPSNGGSAITDFKIYRGTLSGATSYLASTGSGSSTGYVATGLTNGQSYVFNVTAVNALGESVSSVEVTATPSGRPSAPTLSATKGNAYVDLSWTTPASDGGLPITTYHIYRGTVSGATTWIATTGAANTSFRVNSLTNGQLYYFNVTAASANGQGTSSNEASATPSTVPTAPLSLSATAQDGQVQLTWSAPSSNGGSAITDYYVYRGTTSGAATYLAATSGVLSYTATGLTNGQTYYFNVTAVNANGQGPSSSQVSATPATTPGAPTSLTAIASNGTITLSWNTPASSGGSTLTNYYIYSGTTSSTTFLAATGGTNTSFVVNGLTNGQTYFFNVTAVNAVGQGTSSSQTSAVPAAVPFPASNLAASAGNASVALTWTAAPNNGGSAITGYNIYRGTSSGGETFLATAGSGNTSFTDLTVTNGNTYYYNITAVNANGQSASSNEASALPRTVPYPPATFTLTASLGQLSLSWSAGNTGGSAITSYQVWRGTTSGGESLLYTASTANTSYVDLAVTVGTTYYYQIYAVNAVGTSNPSIERSGTPGWYTYASTSVTDLNGGTISNAANYQSDASGATATLTEAGPTTVTSYPTSANDRHFNTTPNTWTLTGSSNVALTFPATGGNPGGAMRVLSTSGTWSATTTISFTLSSPASQNAQFFADSYTEGGGTITFQLVKPDASVVTLGTNSAGVYTSTSVTVASSDLSQTGTYSLRVAIAGSGNNKNTYVDNIALNIPTASNNRFGKAFTVSSIPTGSSYTLSVRAATGTNAENLQLQDSVGTVLGTFTSASQTIINVTITPSSGSYTLRLVDATTSSDTTASTWEVDYIRVVTHP